MFTNYLNMIDDELQVLGDTPKQQYEAIKKLKSENIEMYSRLRQAETLLVGLLKTPGMESIMSILTANYKTITGKEWADYEGNEARIEAFHQKLPYS